MLAVRVGLDFDGQPLVGKIRVHRHIEVVVLSGQSRPAAGSSSVWPLYRQLVSVMGRRLLRPDPVQRRKPSIAALGSATSEQILFTGGVSRGQNGAVRGHFCLHWLRFITYNTNTI